MEFRLLGPVEIVLDSEPTAITAARQETVLAVLLLEANRVVPVSRLVDALWDDEPPTTARSQVQICVSALRRMLAPAGDGVAIMTRPSGYLLRLPENVLDVERFNALVAEGAALAGERPAEAVERYRAALALWRGEAASGVESRIVRQAATVLNESRIATLETCIELELLLGRHHAVVGELSDLVATYPLRERLRAQLMVALYRSSRQAEALEVFRVGREVLQVELGLNPGEELQELEHAILVNDSSLDLPDQPAPVTAPGPWTAPVPRQLPGTVADFTGRQDMLDRVCAALTPQAGDDGLHVAIVTLSGKGGVGKTALALRAGHRLRDRFPDGQLFAELRDASGHAKSPAGILEQFLRSFGVSPATIPRDLDDLTAMYRSLLAERRLLIVLDNAVGASQIEPLLPGSLGCAVITTSRNRLTGAVGASNFEVDALDESTGVELVSRIIGPARARAETDQVRTLVRLCGGLPLALRIVAAKLSARPHWRVGQMVARLENEKRRLDEIDLDGTSIRATIEFSYLDLDEDAKRLLRRISLLGAVDFASWICAPLLDIDIDAAEDLLEELVAAWLVEAKTTEDGSVRYHLHELVRLYAVEVLAETEPLVERQSVLRRLLGCWLALASEAHRRQYGGDFSTLHSDATRWSLPASAVDVLLQDPIRWFQDERNALVAAIYQAGRAGLDDLCWDLAMTTVTLFEAGSYRDDWRQTHEAALIATRGAGNHRGTAALLYSLGLLTLTGQLEDAARDLHESLRIFDDLGDVHGRTLALSGLAFIDRQKGDYYDATAKYELVLSGFRESGDVNGEADALKSLAQIRMDRGHYDIAEKLLNEAIAVSRKARAQRTATQAEYHLAELFRRQGNLELAEDLLLSVRRVAQDGGDDVGRAFAQFGLGVTRAAKGDDTGARTDLQAAFESANQLGHQLLRGQVLLALVELDISAGQLASAAVRLREAESTFRNLGFSVLWRGRCLEMSGRLHQREGRIDAAADSWRAALELLDGVDPALTERIGSALADLQSGPNQRRTV
jgi:DNA-binding SARP family transcriptional activator/tetratricopeptide (TPR) repeat protein